MEVGIHTSCHVLQANIEHSIVQRSSHQKFQRQIWTYISRGLLSSLRASHTVNPFLVCESLSLLSSVPLDDKSVPESQRSARISSSNMHCYRPRVKAWKRIQSDLQLITIKQRTGKSGLDMSDCFVLCHVSILVCYRHSEANATHLKLFLCSKTLGGLLIPLARR